jgi:hypothetical protein
MKDPLETDAGCLSPSFAFVVRRRRGGRKKMKIMPVMKSGYAKTRMETVEKGNFANGNAETP